MTNNPQINGSAAASHHEIEAMACILEGRHGIHAADVAEFFATAHVISRDLDRSCAWQRVAHLVRARELRRRAGALR